MRCLRRVISSEEDLTLTSLGRTAAWSRVTASGGQHAQGLALGTLLAGRYALLEAFEDRIPSGIFEVDEEAVVMVADVA